MTTQVKFKHRDGFGGPHDTRVATGTYHKDGTFTVEIPNKYGMDEPEVHSCWTPEDAQRLFTSGFWIKVEPEVLKFMCHGSDKVYTATIQPDEGTCKVSWACQYSSIGEDSMTYRVATVRENLRTGEWREVHLAASDEYVDVPEPQPEPTDIQKARVLIGEQNLMVIMNGDNYQVDGFNSYKAKNDAELLKICQLLEELKQYE